MTLISSRASLVMVLAVIGVVAMTRHAPAQSDLRRAIPIGATRVTFTNEHVDQNSLDVRAFVPTGSSSLPCLVTMAESNFAIPGISVFCSPRIHEDQSGVLVSVFFPTPPPSDLLLVVTLYQEQAQEYGSPVLYTGQ
jgi:hypothetical protein